jgi:hypothetical protein
MNILLTPVQQAAAKGLLDGISAGGILVLEGGVGQGKTTILRKLHSETGGAFIGMREFMATLSDRYQAVVEGAFMRLLEESLAGHDIAIVDDLHLVVRAATRCRGPQTYILDAALTAILGEARVLKKTLVFGVAEDETPWPVRLRACTWKIGKFASRGRSSTGVRPGFHSE